MRPPWNIFEVLHGIGHINAVPWYAGFGKSLIKLQSSGANEGLAGEVFLIAGLFTDQHDRCRNGPLAEDGLSRRFPKSARAAAARLRPRFLEGGGGGLVLFGEAEG